MENSETGTMSLVKFAHMQVQGYSGTLSDLEIHKELTRNRLEVCPFRTTWQAALCVRHKVVILVMRQ